MYTFWASCLSAFLSYWFSRILPSGIISLKNLPEKSGHLCRLMHPLNKNDFRMPNLELVSQIPLLSPSVQISSPCSCEFALSVWLNWTSFWTAVPHTTQLFQVNTITSTLYYNFLLTSGCQSTLILSWSHEIFPGNLGSRHIAFIKSSQCDSVCFGTATLDHL